MSANMASRERWASKECKDESPEQSFLIDGYNREPLLPAIGRHSANLIAPAVWIAMRFAASSHVFRCPEEESFLQKIWRSIAPHIWDQAIQ